MEAMLSANLDFARGLGMETLDLVEVDVLLSILRRKEGYSVPDEASRFDRSRAQQLRRGRAEIWWEC